MHDLAKKKIYMARYQADHREELKAYYRKYNAARSETLKRQRAEPEHRDHIKIVVARYRTKNRTRLLAKSAQYDATHKQEKKVRDARRYAENREALRAKGREYYKLHRDQQRVKAREYHLVNRERINAKSATYLAAHPEVFSQKCAKRRALKKGVTIGDPKSITAWMISWKRKRTVICYWCGGHFPGSKCQADHIEPLSKGGTHSLKNLCVACPTCNLGKNAKLPMQWNRTLEQPRLFL